jgi:two-component system sensor histidine kinase YesM
MLEKKLEKINSSIRNKLVMLMIAVAVPFVVVLVYLIYALHSYSNAYAGIVNNITIANNYNLNFKEEMDESLYKLVVGSVTFETIGADEDLEDPYLMLTELRGEFENLLRITTDEESRTWLQILMRDVDTLEDRVDDIRENLEAENSYDKNIEMLNNNIYVITELIQDDIQSYIYYQTKSMGYLATQLNTRVQEFIWFCGILLVLLMLLVMAWAFIIVSGITSPIRELLQVTERVSRGDFSVRARVEGKDEMAVLADSVNSMTESLEMLVQKIKEDERNMRRAELRLLQEQINPHFLYNTLDTIVWLIEGHDTDKAVSMVMSLSQFFRLVLNKGREYITVQEEKTYIESYLEIQQVRYRDIMDYEVRIPPELYSYKILKLTLQPLVENSLYHGIKNKRAKGIILVSGELIQGRLYFQVQDDGVGMEPEELEKLKNEISKPCRDTEKGFGLANVNERIHMYFGNEYGMHIESKAGEGTCVEIVLPALSGEVAEG